ncbi:prostatic acid phosphatase-like [Babylonia areolata]|uniref:prostatic acid phosphatase-like n=1 Tax=Babylonia areolata TaxID=304850 RepID=UPI003FCF6D25
MAGQTEAMLSFVFFTLFASTVATSPDTLQLVNMVYRHGDRSPEFTFPTDANKDKWSNGPGWLTTVGMRQQYALGQFFHSEYGHLLSQAYNNTEITVASSNVNRCLMSAYCNLAGLYPPQGEQVWNPKLLWQPIPVHTRPEDEDHVLAIDEKCPLYDQLYDAVLHSPAVVEEEKSNAELYDYVAKNTGIKKVNISDLWKVADNLFCQRSHNYSLPEWAEAKWDNETVYDKMIKIGDFSFQLLFNGSELSRLKGGPLLKMFIQNMVQAAQKQQHYKMYMYSAHDDTVAAVSDALKVFNGIKPPYASTLMVELHLVEEDYCVKIRYRNRTAAPFTLIHPDCQKECCPLEEFVAVTKNEVPVNWEKECGNTPKSVAVSESYMEVIIGILIAVIVVMGFLMLVLTVRLHSLYKALTSRP